MANSENNWGLKEWVVGSGLLALVAGAWLNQAKEQQQANVPVKALPAHLNNDGETVFPYRNPSTQERAVKAAFFQELSAGPIDGIGAASPPREVRFEPKHYDANTRRWSRYMGDEVFKVGESGWLVPRLVDPKRAEQRVYGRLILQYVEGEPTTFLPAWVMIHAD